MMAGNQGPCRGELGPGGNVLHEEYAVQAQGCPADCWAPEACSSRHRDCRVFAQRESLALFFSSGINSFEEWVGLGLWHLLCDLCPHFPLAAPATPPYMWVGWSRD